MPVPRDRRGASLTLCWEGPLEKEMAAHSGIPALGTPWTEEPGGLQSMGPQEQDTTATLAHTS